MPSTYIHLVYLFLFFGTVSLRVVNSQGQLAPFTIFPDKTVSGCDVTPTCYIIGADKNSGTCGDLTSNPFDCEKNCEFGFGGTTSGQTFPFTPCGGFAMVNSIPECYYKTVAINVDGAPFPQCTPYDYPGTDLYRKDIVCLPTEFCSTSLTGAFCKWISWNTPGCLPVSNTATSTATSTGTTSFSAALTPLPSSSTLPTSSSLATPTTHPTLSAMATMITVSVTTTATALVVPLVSGNNAVSFMKGGAVGASSMFGFFLFASIGYYFYLSRGIVKTTTTTAPITLAANEQRSAAATQVPLLNDFVKTENIYKSMNGEPSNQQLKIGDFKVRKGSPQENTAPLLGEI